MKTTKTIIAALMLTFTLASCDSVVQNENAPVVETPAEDPAAVETTEPAETTDTADTAETVDPAAEDTTVDTTEDAATDLSGDANDDVADDSAMTADGDVRAALEQAIFDNRSQARAIEILFELTPENVAGVADQLQAMLDESNSLLAEAQAVLDELDAQQ